MRILVISYLFPNRIYPNHGIFVLNRLKAVQAYCDIKVINPIPFFPFSTRFRRYKDFNKIPYIEIIEGIEVYHPRFFIIPRFFKWLDAITFAIATVPLAIKIKKVYPFDIIDLHWTYPDILSGYILSKIFKKKLLITVRGKEALNLFPTESDGSIYCEENSLRTRILKYLLPKANFVITLSKELETLCLAYGISSQIVRTITNGVDNVAFHYLDKEKCRLKLDLSKDKRIILSVGSLIYGKGFDRIISIFPDILNHYPDSEFYIIGSEGPAGSYKKELLELISLYGLKDNVKLIGHVDNHDLLLWYNAADIFCLASRGEGSPNVLTEALACGCPSVATDVGSVSEIICQDFMGIVVNNEKLLLKAILSAFSKQYDRKVISDFMRQYDWDWCARNVIQIYHRLLRNLI